MTASTQRLAEACVAEVRLQTIGKRFGGVAAVEDLSLTVGDGEFVVLLGPTGAGKTTTLRLIAGLEQPDTGRVWIGGRDMTRAQAAARDVAFVFQQYSLYPHMSVSENLAFPLRAPIRATPEPQIQARVLEVARLLRIEDKLSARVTALSGGQMQRVAIGRALVRSPSIYLMDEPLSSLDAKLRADLRVEIKRIQQDMGATILFVTHDQTEAMTLANRVGVMERGRLIQVGSPRDIYCNPLNAYVATRLGSPAINLLPRRLFPGTEAPPATETIGARTEHVRIRKANGGMGKVTWVEHLGDQDHLHIHIADQDLVTLSDPDSGLSPGDQVDIQFVNPLFFDGAGTRIEA
jgi:multiple sugar transport system ATP-binding protein